MACSNWSPARRRYERRALAIAVIWAPLILLTAWKGRHLTGVWAYMLATFNAIPVIGLIVAFGIYLAEESDEFERNIHVQALLWGIGATMALCMFVGCLELVGLIRHPSLFGVFAFFVFSTTFARWLVRLRYR